MSTAQLFVLLKIQNKTSSPKDFKFTRFDGNLTWRRLLTPIAGFLTSRYDWVSRTDTFVSTQQCITFLQFLLLHSCGTLSGLYSTCLLQNIITKVVPRKKGTFIPWVKVESFQNPDIIRLKCEKLQYAYKIRPLVNECVQKINFLISQPKHMLWVLKRTISMRWFFWAPKIYVSTDG